MSAKSANKHPDLGETTVRDMFTKAPIAYVPGAHGVLHKYDFHFTKDGEWWYVNSFDDISCDVWRAQARTVESKGESWRIIDVAHNTIVKQHKAKPKK